MPTSWTDTSPIETSWYTPTNVPVVITLSLGSPIGLLLCLTYAANQTITTGGDAIWRNSDTVSTAWS